MLRKYLQLFLAVALFFLLSGCTTVESLPTQNGTAKMHFIDVGQGDSTLIQLGEKTVLIDGGTREAGTKVVDYLKAQKVEKIDLLISTHPHEDHIGGLREVLRQFPIDLILDPLSDHDTSVYRAYKKIAQQKGIVMKQAKQGQSYDLGAGGRLEVVYCDPKAEEVNDTSIVVKITYGQIAALFTGDLESGAEKEIQTKAQILQVGHHGSKTSTSVAFLKEVQPQAAIISCGKSNEYGHPHQITLQKLETNGVKVYRTDKSGDIILETDGKTYQIKAQSFGFTPKMKNGQVVTKNYIGNRKSHRYHLTTCKQLPKEENRISFSSQEAATKAGYEKCQTCNP